MTAPGHSGFQQPYDPHRPMSPSSGYLQPPASSRISHSASDESAHNPFQTPSENGVSNKFSLGPDPSSWGAELSPNYHEFDDYLHTPDRKGGTDHNIFTLRGLANLGCLFVLATTLIGLFAGYPLISYFLTKKMSTLGGYNLGGINSTGQVMETAFALIDSTTPAEAMTYTSMEDGTQWQLVFSDEFTTDGRSFYPGDDPFWEAVDLHYWGTNNLEWYSPEHLTTENGHLKVTLDNTPNHGMQYMGGMMSTWNKFCFTGGIIVTNVVLPGRSDVYGLWPAVWTMGNLGRAGYGASLDGMWPYTYEACDVGTLPNQTQNGLPEAALTSGDSAFGGELSYLPGQRLSACTCPGEEHPGPQKRDGSFVGRAAPEIDVIEAQVSVEDRIGHVSQSAQWAPFDAFYSWNNVTYMEIYDPTVSTLNLYKGAVYQQASSVVSITDQNCYEGNTGCFSVYGFEYKEGYESDGGYITWINDNKKAWRLGAGGLGDNPISQVSARPVPKEPLYIIINLGLSENFGDIDFPNIQWPVNMLVDYIRVYQHPDRINIGCDPTGFPTSNYISRFIEAYSNPNLTTWVDDYGQVEPRSSLRDGGC